MKYRYIWIGFGIGILFATAFLIVVGLDTFMKAPGFLFLWPIILPSVIACNSLLGFFPVADGWGAIAQLGAVSICSAYLTIVIEAGLLGAVIGGCVAYLKRNKAN
jgi:hypothetical protein